jgi:mannose-1-phosphate guanylyltransferase
MIEYSSSEFPSFPGFPARRRDRAAVILAGGDGSRLKALTRLITGDERPKQFCPVIGGETLLDKTRSRVSSRIARENIYFSLTKKHQRFFRDQLADVSEKRLVIQPESKGTAPAILYSLLRVANDSPNATVAFFPSDHYFSDDQAFMNYVDAAFRAVDREPESVVLLGIEADKPETSYGWIEPEESMFGNLPGSVSRVSQFWEKPSHGTAKRLMAKGSLWNSFVMVGKVEAFLAMFGRHQPKIFRMFQAAATQMGKATESAVIRAIYSWIGEANFSTEVLERSAEMLRVLRVTNVSWSDLGEPARVIGTLNALGVQTNWMQAVAA